jgi:hypothetical protein
MYAVRTCGLLYGTVPVHRYRKLGSASGSRLQQGLEVCPCGQTENKYLYPSSYLRSDNPPLAHTRYIENQEMLNSSG